MTKLTELHIRPETTYLPFGKNNPMIATVKLNSDQSVIETRLSSEVMHKILLLCQEEIINEAKRNMDEFVSTVTAIETPVEVELLELDTNKDIPF